MSETGRPEREYAPQRAARRDVRMRETGRPEREYAPQRAARRVIR